MFKHFCLLFHFSLTGAILVPEFPLLILYTSKLSRGLHLFNTTANGVRTKRVASTLGAGTFRLAFVCCTVGKELELLGAKCTAYAAMSV